MNKKYLVTVLCSLALGFAACFFLCAKEEAPVVAESPPKDKEIVLLGAGEIEFRGYSQATIFVDGGQPLLVDGNQYKEVALDGSYRYTKLPIFKVKKQAIVRLHYGDFKFVVEESAHVLVENKKGNVASGTVKIDGQGGYCIVHTDDFIYLSGDDVKFDAKNLPSFSVSPTTRRDDGHLQIGSLHAVNCQEILFHSKSFKFSDDQEVVIHYDQKKDEILTSVAK